MADGEAGAPGKSRHWIAALLIVVIAVALVAWALRLGDASPKTDDAYAVADTIGVVPEIAGRIVALPVQDNQRVKQGDVLLQVDPRPYALQVAHAQAELHALDEQIKLTRRTVQAQEYNAKSVAASVAGARANAEQAASTLRRVEPLLAQGYASAEEVERARTASQAANAHLQAVMLQAQQAAAAVSGVDALVAQKAAVQARLALAQLNLEFTTVRAPFNGVVASLNTTVGQYASPAKPVFTLIDTEHWSVVGNFRETDLSRIHAGDAVTIYLLSDTGRRFKGVVDSIGFGVQPSLDVPGALPFVQRTINWVHVAQRFPVRIRVEDPDPALFRVGATATVVIHPGERQRQAAPAERE